MEWEKLDLSSILPLVYSLCALKQVLSLSDLPKVPAMVKAIT